MTRLKIFTLAAAVALVFSGPAFAEASQTRGGTFTTDNGKSYDIQQTRSIDGHGNYNKELTVNDKTVRTVEGGHGTRTITRGNGYSRTVTRPHRN